MFSCSSCILILFITVKNSFSGNILITMDLPSPSHQIWHYALAEALLEKGHNITIIGPFSDKGQRSEKYHPIVIEGVFEEIEKHFNIEESIRNMNLLSVTKIFYDYAYVVCKYTCASKGLHSLLNYPPDFKFDLIIIDMTTSPCLYPLIQKFNYPPTIGTTPFLLPPYLSGVFGNDLYPSYIPFFHLQFTEDMSFFERFINYVFMYGDYYMQHFYLKNELEKLAKNTFTNMNSMRVLERHISLLLCNVNIAFNQPQSMTSNIIPVGGLHIRPSKKLPEEFQKIMDEAKHGVILLCLGTNARSDKLESKTINALLDAFALLNQTVIWKFESELKNVPKNVIIRQWIPQGGILGHPNMKLFMTHGGALSTQEAAYFGVPMIGMPFFIDQRILVNDFVKKNLGLRMDVDTVTSEIVLVNVNEILQNPIYSNNMKEISRRTRDLPNPLQTAVFWSEYAMRHNGAHFLNPKSRDLSFFVASSADVELFLLIVVLSFVFVIFFLLQKCACIIAPRRRNKDKIH